MTSQTVSLFSLSSDFEIEQHLSSSLNPVLPDPIFIDRLEQRLKREPAIVLEPGSFIKAYIIMVSGLVGGVVLLLLLHMVYRELRKLPMLNKQG